MQISRAQGAWLLVIGISVAVGLTAWSGGLTSSAPPRVVLTPEETGWLARHGPLRFAPDPNFPPIEFFDAGGVYRGLVADYFRLIEQRLGVPIEIVRYPTWDEVLAAARAGAVDGVTAAQITPDREAYLGYTAPILDIPNVIIVRTDRRGELSLADLDDQRVAVTQGNALDEHIRRHFPAIRVAPEPDDLSCLKAVSFGRADATVVNLAIASELIEQQGISNLRVAGDSGRSNPLAIAVRRDEPLLLGVMAKGLAAVRASERTAIRRRWIRLDVASIQRGRTLARMLFLVAASMAVAAAAFVGWNAVLRRRVLAATASLQNELGERRRVEEALRASQRKLAAHLEQTLFFVIEWDRDFRVVDWNPAAERVFGHTRDQALGLRGIELLVPDDARAGIEELWKNLVGGRGGLYSINDNVTRDGRRIVCEWFNTTLFDERGEVTGAMSIGQDVTDRVRSADALAQSERLGSLAVLAGGIAHDFNNLLAGILGNVALAVRDRRLAPELREALTDAESAAKRARGLTQQLLTFSRGGSPVRRLVDLEAVVSEAAHFAASGSNCLCTVRARPGLWPAEVDSDQIGQAVQNLVLNAAEAMPHGGPIEIEIENVEPGSPGVEADGAWLRLRVADRGPGIDPDVLPRIFDPFFSTKERGSGLGLAVCHSIAIRHGGSIRALARPGGGTAFELLLPARPGARLEATAPEGAAAPTRVRLLLLDDEEALRRLAHRLFERMGCEVVTTADGDDVVRLYEEARRDGRPFDLVVLDLTVPGGTGGMVAFERLRALDPAVRAVVSSGYSTDPVMASHREHGFAAVLPKPFTPAEARRALDAALAAHLPASAPASPRGQKGS